MSVSAYCAHDIRHLLLPVRAQSEKLRHRSKNGGVSRSDPCQGSVQSLAGNRETLVVVREASKHSEKGLFNRDERTVVLHR